MSRYTVTYGSESIVVELGQPEHPILVDGYQIGRQCADGACRTDACIRIACAHAWPEESWDAGSDAWDEMSYEECAEEPETVRARLVEEGNYFPARGAYVVGEGSQLYRVVCITGNIQTSGMGGNWVTAELEPMGDWAGHEDVTEADVFPVRVSLGA